jgi:hypothetical protein
MATKMRAAQRAKLYKEVQTLARGTAFTTNPPAIEEVEVDSVTATTPDAHVRARAAGRPRRIP